MSLALALIVIWLLAATVMALGWLWQWRHCNAGIVDALWALLLAAAATCLALLGPGAALSRVTIGVCATTWGLRLGLYLWRRVHDEAEDGRYRALREHWHGRQSVFFIFFQFQAGLVVLFSLPFAAVAWNKQPSTVWLAVGTVIWLLALIGESIADRQLARFRANASNRGRTCRTGLWRHSRHPNYFFEWLMWIGYAVIATGSLLVWLAWLGPAVMYLFLRYLSGIPFTEQQALRNRGDDYRAYQRSTSAFFPWFVRDQ